MADSGILIWLVGGIVLLAALVYASALLPAAFGAPWLPTPRRRVRRMLALADVQPGARVLDLGAGDGRVLLVAAREFGAEARGVEIDPFRWLWVQARITLSGLRGRVRCRLGSLLEHPLHEADVIVIYLLPNTNKRLARKLLRECKPGARVVAHAFSVPLLPLVAHDAEHNIWLYEIGDAARSRK